jgi:hypothetical protein
MLPWIAATQPVVPAPQAPTPADNAQRDAARAVLFGAFGFAVGAFFLSQSYKAMLFLTCGMVAGRYLGMREARMPLPRFSLASSMPFIGVVAVGSVVFMWVLVRVLL